MCIFVDYGKHLSSLKLILFFATMAALLSACTIINNPETVSETKQDDFENLYGLLDQDGQNISYHNLLQVYWILNKPPRLYSQTNQVIRRLIDKRNPNPRIDQMVLICAALIIGHSSQNIPDAQSLFEYILMQRDRLNSWVLSFVAEAIGDYPFDLPEGDKVVDIIEAELTRVRSLEMSSSEYFGFHFLPPPESMYIQNFVEGEEARLDRELNRRYYYSLIYEGWSEEEIEAALKYLQAQKASGRSDECRLLLRCLWINRHQISIELSQRKVSN